MKTHVNQGMVGQGFKLMNFPVNIFFMINDSKIGANFGQKKGCFFGWKSIFLTLKLNFFVDCLTNIIYFIL